jgi:GGDEF domain-containing protein
VTAPTIEALQVELAHARAEILDLRATADRLYHETTHDELTGLYNRKGLRLEWERDVDHLDAVALLDLDGFKQINDTHGHAAGDAVLVHAARDLTGRYRIAARLSGDELVIVDCRGRISDLARADAALYDAKQAQRGTARWFDRRRHPHLRRVEQLDPRPRVRLRDTRAGAR